MRRFILCTVVFPIALAVLTLVALLDIILPLRWWLTKEPLVRRIIPHEQDSETLNPS